MLIYGIIGVFTAPAGVWITSNLISDLLLETGDLQEMENARQYGVNVLMLTSTDVLIPAERDLNTTDLNQQIDL